MVSSAPNRPVYLAVIFVSAAYAAALYWSGVALDSTPKKLLSYMPAAAGLVLSVWSAWLWYRRPLHWLVTRPRLHGLWVGELMPTAESHIPDGGNRGPIPTYMVFHQRYWSMRVEQFTAESYSKSRSYFWERCTDESVESLGLVYENIPKQAHQHRSERHYGACSLRIGKKTPKVIEGVYFTDRYTQGDMSLRFVDGTVQHETFQSIHDHVEAMSFTA